jgi:hypothetical protein
MKSLVATVKIVDVEAVIGIGTAVEDEVGAVTGVAQPVEIATEAPIVTIVPAAPAKKQHQPAKRQPAAVAMTPTGTNWTNGFGMTQNLLPRMLLLPSLKQPLKMMISKATPLNVR